MKPWYSHPWFQLLLLFAVSFCIKMALAPAYFSTDHDVHQNWLRITATLPLQEWYFDTQTLSKWTLDYPPFFAYFEKILSSFSKIISPSIANTINQSYLTIYFQRATVMLSEIPYLLTLFWIFGQVSAKLALSYFFLPLILLDNIHFQYNIIMQALFLVSIEFIRRKEYAKGAFAYSILLNFKHIYLYAALAFFAYILKECVLAQSQQHKKIRKLAQIAVVTIIPFMIAFAPFLMAGGFAQVRQIFSRLFPFQRGLIHDYWAPNFWAFYYFVDKTLGILFSKFSPQTISIKQVGQLHSLKVLPNIAPFWTTLIILAATLPLLWVYFRQKHIKFEWLVFLCGCTFFLFGFHVHQKAITPYICILAVFLKKEEQNENLLDCAIFVNLVNLLPLLIEPNEKLLRLALPLLWVAIWQRRRDIQSTLQVVVVTLGLSLVVFHELLHPLMFGTKMQFLPLMLNSLFAATFNLSWISKLYYSQLRESQDRDVEYKQVPSQSLEEQVGE